MKKPIFLGFIPIFMIWFKLNKNLQDLHDAIKLKEK
jgi:hypothetical protein